MKPLRRIKIINVIKKDATIAGKLWDGDEGFCVLGGLADAAGFPRERMLHKAYTRGIFALLERVYGLTQMESRDLMSTNDFGDYTGIDTVPLRRARLIKAVKRMR